MYVVDGFQDGWCPLMIAALNGHSDVVDTLLQYGATVDKDKDVSVVDDINHEHSHAFRIFRPKFTATELEIQCSCMICIMDV